jgi:hypothetical protein
MVSDDIIVQGIGGCAEVHIYSETDKDLAFVTAHLNYLANDSNANRGIGVYPLSITGSVEIVCRLNSIEGSNYTFLGFCATGIGEHGLAAARDKIMRDPFFLIAVESTKSLVVHECLANCIYDHTDSVAIWQRSLWEIPDYIIYQTNNSDENWMTSVVALLAVSNDDIYKI